MSTSMWPSKSTRPTGWFSFPQLGFDHPSVVLTIPPWFLCDLNTGSAGTGPQLTPSGGWRRAQNLMAATSNRVGSPSRSPCPSSSSPVQLSSPHLLPFLSHIKSRCAGTSQRGNGGLHGARHLRHLRHARHARHPRRARSLGVEPGGEGGGCWEAKTLSRSNCHSPYFVVIL